MKLTIKQTIALDYLEDDETIELLFGGGAGGGKSALGCYWQIKRRLMYPGTRGLIGRSKLKTLKETTLKTFFEVAEKQGLKKDRHFWLTGSHDKENPNCIMFYNGSMIYLKDLFLYPSDPDFDNLGSFEITDAFIDECNQVVQKAKDVVKSRIRFRLDDFNLLPKLLMTCNPAKNWTYSEFYKAWKERTLPKTKKFIQSLLTDNPYITKHYKTMLLTMAKQMVERLLYGNWEFNDDPLLLFSDYDKILELFTNEYVVGNGKRYLTADIAYLGSDKFVIGIWDGFVVEKIYAFDKIDETQVSKKINDLRLLHKIPLGNVIYDADGLKKYVRQSAETGFLKGARQFNNGGKCIGKENYFNLKAQCYFKLAEMVNDNKIFCLDQEYRDQIIKELEQIKQKDRSDNTEAIRLESKKDLKERLGHSPDFTDMLMMRMLAELSITVVYKADKKTVKGLNR